VNVHYGLLPIMRVRVERRGVALLDEEDDPLVMEADFWVTNVAAETNRIGPAFFGDEDGLEDFAVGCAWRPGGWAEKEGGSGKREVKSMGQKNIVLQNMEVGSVMWRCYTEGGLWLRMRRDR